MKFPVVAAAVLLCAVCSLAQSQHPDLKSGKKQLHSVALMPIQVRLTKLGLKGPEPMVAESRETELPLALEIRAVLRELGYNLDRGSLSQPMLEKDADLHYAVDDLQKRFDTELPQMRRKSKGVRKGRFTIGEQVANLPLSNDDDALLFVQVKGQVLTNNKQAFGFFVAGPLKDVTFMDFGIVDAKTGDVLYFAKSMMLADITRDSEETAATIKRAFRDLPKASPSLLRDQQNPPSSTSDGPVTIAVESGKPLKPADSLPSASAPDAGSPPRRIPLSHGVLKGTLIRKVPPEYPGIASANQVQGVPQVPQNSSNLQRQG